MPSGDSVPTPAASRSPAAPDPGQVTQILHAAKDGDPRASAELLPLVYDELRRLAQGAMSNERGHGAGHTLQATALVHEAYLRLVGPGDVSWNSRGHFFAAAALAMRRILVERARHKKRLKRGEGRRPVELSEALSVVAETDTPADGTDLVALDAALDRLGEYDRRKYDVVMLKYFAGLSNDETAAALGVSSATVRNEWTFAKAWLLRELSRDEREGGSEGEVEA